MADSWRVVAEVLAARMAYQANNCPVGSGFRPDGHGGLEFHGDERHVPEEHEHDCPFCADTLAYRRYLRKRAQST